MTKTPHEVGLCLVAEARDGPAWRDRLMAALDATAARTLILTPPETGAFDIATTEALVEQTQARHVAALIADDSAVARATGADGVHLRWSPDIEDTYEAARSALGPDAIVGAEGGTSRHDAMALGEGGADYVAFAPMIEPLGEDNARAAQRELVAWWSELFVVPVVAGEAETAAHVAEAVRAGADFVAVRLPDVPAGSDPAASDAAWAGALRAALLAPAGAA